MPTVTYHVSIDNPNAGAAPADGFIDNTKIEKYIQDGSSPADYDEATAKKRANQRFEFMIEQIEIISNVFINNIVATNADASTEATTFEFDLTVEHGEDSLVTEDELNEGEYLYGTDCLKRSIARSFLVTKIKNMDIYDPTLYNPNNTPNAYERRIYKVEVIEVGAMEDDLLDAEALITIT